MLAETLPPTVTVEPDRWMIESVTLAFPPLLAKTGMKLV
jgi:hypothetical protein